MNWVNTALLSAAIMGMVSILDSHLLFKRMPGLRSFLLPVGIIHLIYGSLLFALFPLPQGAGIWPVLAAVASGMLRAAAVVIMLDSLRREEVSRVIPVVYTYPIFVAIMAMPLLGEFLNSLEWLAIVIVVVGAVMVSITQSPSGSIRWRGKPLLLFSASLLFAVADIAGKYALAYISFWNMFWLSAFCMSGIFLLVSVRPQVIGQVIKMEQRNSAIGLLVFNETLAPIGIVLSFWALERGPVSLVSTIISSRPMFVLMAALILSRLSPMFLEWRYGKWMLAMRLIATAMIVSGIAIIHLV
ncbi:MAG: EamA family transporter [Dehalococcoidia bacterium]|nr:EamA family transporter [Dehalococcoidia bacterium]